MDMMRIASLLPSVTDILVELGLKGRIVGCSHECEYITSDAACRVLTKSAFEPATMEQGEIDRVVKADAESMRRKGRDGAAALSGIYTVLGDELAACRPTLLFTQALCGVCAANVDDVTSTVRDVGLRESCDVVSISPSTLDDVAASCQTIADACGCAAEGRAMRARFSSRIEQVNAAVRAGQHRGDRLPRVLLLEWLDPPFLGGHWTADMISAAGCEPVLSVSGARSTECTWTEIVNSDPDVILVACCGFDLHRNIEDSLQSLGRTPVLRAFREGRLFAVDGNAYFAKPSQALALGVAIVARCAHDGDASICEALETLLPTTRSWHRIRQADVPSATASEEDAIEDVEDTMRTWQRVHDEACARGETAYADPGTGYHVFTAVAHRKRGKCCGKGCRHCPFQHSNLRLEDRAKRSQQPSMLVDFCRKTERNSGPYRILSWSGGKDSFLCLRKMALEGVEDIVLLTTFDVVSRRVPEQEYDISSVVAQAKHLGIPLIGVPLASGDSFQRKMAEAMRVIGSTWGDACIQSLAFADLHLEHIREWRDHALTLTSLASAVSATQDERDAFLEHFCIDFTLEYPLWHEEYSHLITQLEASGVPIRITNVTLDEAEEVVKVGQLFTRDAFDGLSQNGFDAMGEKGEMHSLADVTQVARHVALGIPAPDR